MFDQLKVFCDNVSNDSNDHWQTMMHELPLRKSRERYVQKTRSFLQKPEHMFQVFGGLIVIVFLFGFFQLGENISKPFEQFRQVSEEENYNQALADFNTLLDEQQNDTDGDGLTDYVEENIYKTSKYLHDTDSDGISDQIEVANGTNPLCAEGDNCSQLIPEVSAVAPLLQEFAPTSGSDLDNLVADELRALLIESGIDAELINGLSDEELIYAYQQSVGETSVDPELEQQFISGDLNPETIRDLLRQGGVDDATLAQMNDEELLLIYQQILTEEAQP